MHESDGRGRRSVCRTVCRRGGDSAVTCLVPTAPPPATLLIPLEV
eukprot:COSAG01_NODE_52718_length_344_cov_2.526531_1_plen_44_part_01